MPKPTLTCLLRLSEIIAPGGPLPISRSTWFAWLKEGRVPIPIKLGPRVTAYRAEDIDAFIANPENWAVHTGPVAPTNVLRNANSGGL